MFGNYLYFSVTIKSDSGDVISADRDKIYAHGHWLGRADLAYCMQAGQLVDSTLYSFLFLSSGALLGSF